MRILRFTAENIKRLKIVDITPKSDLIELSGKNRQGKTSVLDAIWWTLGGADNIQDEPVRRGEKSGKVRIDLGDLLVERTFTAGGKSELVVRDKAGADPGTPDRKLPRKSSPQEVLDSLIGRLSFDPLAFFRKKAREQYEELIAIADIKVDIDALDKANAADFETRKIINRDAKKLWAQADTLLVPAGLPEKRLDERAILDTIQNAADHNAKIERERIAREQRRRLAGEAKAKAESIEQDILTSAESEKSEVKALEERIAATRQKWAIFREKQSEQRDVQLSAALEITKRLEADQELPEPRDIQKLRQELEEARGINAQIEQRERRKQIVIEAGTLDRQSEVLTAGMKAREQQKLDALAAAKLPVEGIGFQDGAVLYNGLPLDQASDAERLRVSAAIGMSSNPELRVMRVRDGSLLDEDGVALLAELARERDYQIWMEVVDSSGQVGIVLKDGEVVKDNYAETPEIAAV